MSASFYPPADIHFIQCNLPFCPVWPPADTMSHSIRVITQRHWRPVVRVVHSSIICNNTTEIFVYFHFCCRMVERNWTSANKGWLSSDLSSDYWWIGLLAVKLENWRLIDCLGIGWCQIRLHLIIADFSALVSTSLIGGPKTSWKTCGKGGAMLCYDYFHCCWKMVERNTLVVNME